MLPVATHTDLEELVSQLQNSLDIGKLTMSLASCHIYSADNSPYACIAMYYLWILCNECTN